MALARVCSAAGQQGPLPWARHLVAPGAGLLPASPRAQLALGGGQALTSPAMLSAFPGALSPRSLPQPSAVPRSPSKSLMLRGGELSSSQVFACLHPHTTFGRSLS